MRVSTALAALAFAAAPALAQDGGTEGDFEGVYLGGSIGVGAQPNDAGASILFDTDLDGEFGDTVRTGAGADAFSPGFCPGRAMGTRPANGCDEDSDGLDYFGHVGADTQFGSIVVGIVGDFGKHQARDAVSAFSTTPARYAMERSFRWSAGLRGRIGFTPNDSTLFYATGGAAFAKIRNRFFTSNAANSFTGDGTSDAWGYSAGGGVEQRIGGNLSVGLLYLFSTYEDDEYRILAGPGGAAPTNLFLLANPEGTDFRRSDANFRIHSIRATAAVRF